MARVAALSAASARPPTADPILPIAPVSAHWPHFRIVIAARTPRAAFLAFKPFPHLHLEVPRAVEKREIRNRTRATVLIGATLELPATTPCTVVDLSAGGGRIATANSVLLERDQPIRVAMKLEMIG